MFNLSCPLYRLLKKNCPWQWSQEQTKSFRAAKELLQSSSLLIHVLWGSRVIIPTTGHQAVLERLHECHPGINRMKGLARCYVWWPKLDSDIEQIIQQCNTCQLHRSSPTKAPLHPWEYPQRPWSRIHIDHAGP